MQTRKKILKMCDKITLPLNYENREHCPVKKDNVLSVINMLGEDKIKGTLKSGAPSFEFDAKEHILPFFNYLAACCVKLFDKEVLSIFKENTVKNALHKLSTCHTLRQKFAEMLEKCGPLPSNITEADKIFLLNSLVDKHMNSRQKIEIKRHNLQPKKISLATRASLKVKCSGDKSVENKSAKCKKKSFAKKRKTVVENVSNLPPSTSLIQCESNPSINEKVLQNFDTNTSSTCMTSKNDSHITTIIY